MAEGGEVVEGNGKPRAVCDGVMSHAGRWTDEEKLKKKTDRMRDLL